MVLKPTPGETPDLKVWELGRNEWSEPVLSFEKPEMTITFRPAKTHDKNAEITHGVNDCKMVVEIDGMEIVPEFGTGPTGFPITVPDSAERLFAAIQGQVSSVDFSMIPPISEKLFETGLEGARKLRSERDKGQAASDAELAHKDHPAVPWEGNKVHSDHAREVAESTGEAVRDALGGQ